MRLVLCASSVNPWFCLVVLPTCGFILWVHGCVWCFRIRVCFFCESMVLFDFSHRECWRAAVGPVPRASPRPLSVRAGFVWHAAVGPVPRASPRPRSVRATRLLSAPSVRIAGPFLCSLLIWRVCSGSGPAFSCGVRATPPVGSIRRHRRARCSALCSCSESGSSRGPGWQCLPRRRPCLASSRRRPCRRGLRRWPPPTLGQG